MFKHPSGKSLLAACGLASLLYATAVSAAVAPPTNAAGSPVTTGTTPGPTTPSGGAPTTPSGGGGPTTPDDLGVALSNGANLPNAVGALYKSYTNGPWQNPNFFPIAVWWQAPTKVAPYGTYTSLPAAAAGIHINTFMAMSGIVKPFTWPEYYGRDLGELAALKANNLYMIGGRNTPYLQNTSANSIASMLALASNIGAQSTLIGYVAGDEPSCNPGPVVPDGYNYPPAEQSAATVENNLKSFDPTRVVIYNQVDWMLAPQFQKCLADSITALQASSVGEVDVFSTTNPYGRVAPDFVKSDFASAPNDTLFAQGLAVKAMRHFAAPGQPLWAFVESGSDAAGFSLGHNVLVGTITSGSKVLVNASGWSVFSPTWVGLTLTGPGIPAGAKITSIVDKTHATMSAAATASGTAENIYIGGGVHNSDCVLAKNLCVVNGNEYRTANVEVNAEVWMSIINGANGIEYFCHDTEALDFCLGPTSAGSSAYYVQRNINMVNGGVLRFAAVLNSTTLGMCSMQNENYTTGVRSISPSCSDGILTLSTTNVAIPAWALVKQGPGSIYVFAQTGRRSAVGTTVSMTLAGFAGKTATVVSDSNAGYDAAHSSVGKSFVLGNGGTFTDTIGANGDSYQVKIYQIK
jgi:hypothetical protein